MPQPEPPPGAAVEMAGRLFLAVPLSAATRAALVTYTRDAFRGRPLPGRVVPPENWHLTLRFLGDVTRDQYRALLAQLAAASFGPPFRLTFNGLGAFPQPDRARVLWIGVDEGRDELVALAAVTEACAVAAGFDPETRGPSPHLTLSRLKVPADLSRLVTVSRGSDIAEPVTQVGLFRSHLGGGPPQYETVKSFPLA